MLRLPADRRHRRQPGDPGREPERASRHPGMPLGPSPPSTIRRRGRPHRGSSPNVCRVVSPCPADLRLSSADRQADCRGHHREDGGRSVRGRADLAGNCRGRARWCLPQILPEPHIRNFVPSLSAVSVQIALRIRHTACIKTRAARLTPESHGGEGAGQDRMARVVHAIRRSSPAAAPIEDGVGRPSRSGRGTVPCMRSARAIGCRPRPGSPAGPSRPIRQRPRHDRRRGMRPASTRFPLPAPSADHRRTRSLR